MRLGSLDKFERTFIGLDVHTQSVAACALNPAAGEVVRDKLAAVAEVVLSSVPKLKIERQTVYEALPTGFDPAGHRNADGVVCLLVTPSKPVRARETGSRQTWRNDPGPDAEPR